MKSDNNINSKKKTTPSNSNEAMQASFKDQHSQYVNILNMVKSSPKEEYLDIASSVLWQETMVIIKYTIEKKRNPHIPIRYELLPTFSSTFEKVFREILQLYICTSDTQIHITRLSVLFDILHKSINNLSTIMHEGNYIMNMQELHGILDGLMKYILDDKKKCV